MPSWSPEDEQRLANLKAMAQSLPSDNMGKNDLERKRIFEHPESEALQTDIVDPIDLAAFLAGPTEAAGKAVGRGISSIAESTGIAGVPGRLMANAVGTKYTPKVGSKLVEEGLIGTKGMMQGQIANKLAQRGGELEQAVKSLTGRVESGPVSEEVGKIASRYQTPQGVVPKEVQPEFTKVSEAVSDIGSRGPVSPEEALAFKRIAGNVGYSSDKPLSGLASQIAQKEASGYGKGLEQGFAREFGDQVPNKIEEANSALSALLKAKRGLTSEPKLSLTDLIKLSPVLKSPTANSVAAQALQKAGSAIASPTVGKAAIVEAGKGLSGIEPQSHQQATAWGPEDEAKLMSLKKAMENYKE